MVKGGDGVMGGSRFESQYEQKEKEEKNIYLLKKSCACIGLFLFTSPFSRSLSIYGSSSYILGRNPHPSYLIQFVCFSQRKWVHEYGMTSILSLLITRCGCLYNFEINKTGH